MHSQRKILLVKFPTAILPSHLLNLHILTPFDTRNHCTVFSSQSQFNLYKINNKPRGAFFILGVHSIKISVLCQKEKVVLRYDLFFLRRWGVGANLPPPRGNGYDGVLRCRRVSTPACTFARRKSGSVFIKNLAASALAVFTEESSYFMFIFLPHPLTARRVPW